MSSTVATIVFLLLWTVGTLFLATLVSLALRHTHHVYLPEDDEFFDKETGHVERCTWFRLYGISLLTVGVALVLSHHLIDDPAVRNICLGWGIMLTVIGAAFWLRFSLINRNH
jgi:hypothetical protein